MNGEAKFPFALATFSTAGAAPFGALVVGEHAVALRALTGGSGPLAVGLGGDSVERVLEDWERNLPRLSEAAARIAVDAAELMSTLVPRAGLRRHAPLLPRSLFCTGANYRRHVAGLIQGDSSMRSSSHADEDPKRAAAEIEVELERRAKTGAPYCFVKLTSSVSGPDDTLILPKNVEKPDWELELAVVIGRTARRVTAADAMSHVAGYTMINDITARDHIFRRDGSAIGADWLAGKCHPGFAPLGPWLVPAQFIADVYDLQIKLSVNGVVMQDERTSDMLIGIARQIEHLSNIVTLMPGDVIATGSPAGNGAMHGIFLKAGDVMEGTITGLGQQTIRCIAET